MKRLGQKKTKQKEEFPLVNLGPFPTPSYKKRKVFKNIAKGPSAYEKGVLKNKNEVGSDLKKKKKKKKPGRSGVWLAHFGLHQAWGKCIPVPQGKGSASTDSFSFSSKVNSNRKIIVHLHLLHLLVKKVCTCRPKKFKILYKILMFFLV